VPKLTVYRIFRRVDNNESLELKSGRGRKLKLPKKKIEKFVEENVCTVSKSYRKLGRELKVDGKTAKSYLQRYGVMKLKRESAPKSDQNQEIRQKKRLSKPRRGKFGPTLGCNIILDDQI
jgi:hypothetical protein